MAGRNHRPPPNAVKLRHTPTEDRLVNPRLVLAPASRSVRAAALEDLISAQHCEIQSLLGDNQRLAATHVVLKQELSTAQHELRRLSTVAAEVKSERDAQVRQVYEKSLKLEAEVREIDAVVLELDQVRADVEKLTSNRKELAAELDARDADLARARADAKQVPAIRAEIEIVRQEIQKGRSAIEYEKQNCVRNVQIHGVMEKKMVFMSREIEKLHAELANAEKRARAAALVVGAAANPDHGHVFNYGNPETGTGGSRYPDHPYAVHQGRAGDPPQYAAGTYAQR